MVLSDTKIRELVVEKKLISDFVETNLQAASYDFMSGDIIRSFRGAKGGIDLRKQPDINMMSEDYLITEGYDMMPNEYVLVKVKEKISLPDNIVGHIRPRTTYTKLGLILTGQHINPTFEGYLYVGLRNATPTSLKIYPGLVIGQFVFEEIDGKVTEKLLYKNKTNAKYQNEDGYIPPKVREELPEELKLKYDELVNELAGGK